MIVSRPAGACLAATALGAALLLSGCAPAPVRVTAPLEINLVALNDFHGNLEPSKYTYTPPGATQPRTIQAGGIDVLKGALDTFRNEDPDLLFVAAGDLVGASPAVSSMFADEPSIEALNRMGLVASSLGNHEFDQGPQELLRQQHGGCDSPRPAKACRYAPDFKGAGFTYLAANVVDSVTGKPVLPAYYIEHSKGVNIAFIGAVLKDAASLVLASGVAGLRFTDEAEAINRAAQAARAEGATVFIVLIHEGGDTPEAFDQPDCSQLKGPIVGIANKLDPQIKLIISGHTHTGFQCKVGERVITQAQMGGHVVSRIKLDIDAARQLQHVTVRNVAVLPGQYPADPKAAAYLDTVRARSKEALARPIARVAARTVGRKMNEAGESPLGAMLADAVFDATRNQGAVIGFMNLGGMRSDFDVGENLMASFGEAQVVLPFNNTLVLMDMTGAQLRGLLEQQWQRPRVDADRNMLQISKGFTYRWDKTLPLGQRVLPGSMMLNGVPIDEAKTYRIAANNFLAEGGDGFPMFTKAANKFDSNIRDLDAFVEYLVAQDRAGSPVGTVAPTSRIQRVQ